MPAAGGVLGLSSVLLLTTLFRLALNIASTRAILLRQYRSRSGGRSDPCIWRICRWGNYAVGIVVFFDFGHY